MMGAADATPEPASTVRPATAADLDDCVTIYNEAVRSSVATFDLEPQAVDALFAGKLASTSPLDLFLVAELAGAVIGYAYSYPYRPRPAYDATREVSVYLAAPARGRGVGRGLYAELLSGLDAAGCRTQLAVIALPNDASIALHRSLGFEPVGTLREVGRKFDRWVDTAWYQRLRPDRTVD